MMLGGGWGAFANCTPHYGESSESLEGDRGSDRI